MEHTETETKRKQTKANFAAATGVQTEQTDNMGQTAHKANEHYDAKTAAAEMERHTKAANDAAASGGCHVQSAIYWPRKPHPPRTPLVMSTAQTQLGCR